MTSTVTPSSNPSEIDLGAVLVRAWKLFSEKPAEHILAGLIVGALGGITLGVLVGPLLVGYVQMVDRQRQGQPIKVGDVFQGMSMFWPAFGASLLIGIIAFVGMLLFVLPGLVVLVAWGYALWFIALKNEGITQSLSSSWRLLTKNLSSVIVVFLVVVVLNSAGALVLCGGLFTFPFGICIATLCFRDLVG